jgi:hypothetical protein
MTKKQIQIEMRPMEIVKRGEARQIGRSKSTFRMVQYRIGRCGGELFLIIDGTEPSGGGTTTRKWIPLGRLRPPFEQWAREDAVVAADGGDGPVAHFGKYFKPVLPGNSSMSGRIVAVLRKERVLVAGNMVTMLLPNYPTSFSFRKSVRNPAFGLDDLVAACLALPASVEVLDVPVDRVFNPEDAS